MTDEQKAAYVQSQSTCALIEALGMMSQNMQQAVLGESMTFEMFNFDQLILEWDIDPKTVLGIFRERPKSADEYRELLKIYIGHIGDCEGIDFLDHATDFSGTEEQLSELRALSEEAKK